MGHFEPNKGATDEWYTPKYIFDALNTEFDMDVSAPWDLTKICVPAKKFIHEDSLDIQWSGFIWMNPPFGGRNGIVPWLNKMIAHGNGIALTPDRTSCPWWQNAAFYSDCHMQISGKVKFIDQNGIAGFKPSNGTTLFGFGDIATKVLLNAEKNGLGKVFKSMIAA